MATIGNLRTALDNLITELDSHDTFDQPNDIQQRWFAATARAGELSARLDGAPASAPQYDGVIELLNSAKSALRNADYASAGSVRSALNSVEQALTRLRQVLGG
jgi:hypothetical protein